LPATGEQRPVELHELDPLEIGTGDPGADGFDSRTLVAARGKVVEIRLPWALLGFADPSSLTLYDEQPHGPTKTIDAGRIGIAVLSEGRALLETSGYAWDPWHCVSWHERRKADFDGLRDAMRDVSADPRA